MFVNPSIFPMNQSPSIRPLISVITVTYNAGNVIGKTLESLKEQSFEDFEHIIVDGDSSDNTLEKIRSYNLPQSIVISEKDKGLYDAMNKGIRLAKGQYLIFLNAGDAFHAADTLSHYAQMALNGKDIIFGDTIIVDLNGRFLGNRHLSAPQNLNKQSFAEGMLVCHQAFMVKKNLAPEYDLSYRFSADYDWCVKCIAKSSPANCVNLNEITIDYLSDGLTDKNKWKSLRERFHIMTIHYGFIKTIFNHLSFIGRAAKRGKI